MSPSTYKKEIQLASQYLRKNDFLVINIPTITDIGNNAKEADNEGLFIISAIYLLPANNIPPSINIYKYFIYIYQRLKKIEFFSY